MKLDLDIAAFSIASAIDPEHLQTFPFSRKFSSGVQNNAGVYFFYENSSLVYIGYSSKLRQRIVPSHAALIGLNKQAIKFAYFEVGDNELAQAIEHQLIVLHNPSANGWPAKKRMCDGWA